MTNKKLEGVYCIWLKHVTCNMIQCPTKEEFECLWKSLGVNASDGWNFHPSNGKLTSWNFLAKRIRFSSWCSSYLFYIIENLLDHAVSEVTTMINLKFNSYVAFTISTELVIIDKSCLNYKLQLFPFNYLHRCLLVPIKGSIYWLIYNFICSSKTAAILFVEFQINGTS